MAKIELNTAELDFLETMKQQDDLLGRLVYSKLADGKEPGDIAYLLAYYAEQAHSWCNRQAANARAQQIAALSSPLE